MNKHIKEIILNATKAIDLNEIGKIQDLWSGYGAIRRYGLSGSPFETIIVKHVHWPRGDAHPRGWNTDLSHTRKVKSYEVETAWYSHWRDLCDEQCYAPLCLAHEEHEDEILIILEDLDSSGYSERRMSVTRKEVFLCLSWLAHFHATFLGKSPEGLWPIGTYWHLDTRPDELEALDDLPLKHAASAIDQKLNQTPYQTFVHGDAKLANFCFSPAGDKVAAVDFQYVGGGCGMKDVAYFIGSCLYEDECERHEAELLDHYFRILKEAVKRKHSSIDVTSLESNWRDLYPVAWTDFHRFMKGWSPGHWKVSSYSERLAKKVIKELRC